MRKPQNHRFSKTGSVLFAVLLASLLAVPALTGCTSAPSDSAPASESTIPADSDSDNSDIVSSTDDGTVVLSGKLGDNITYTLDINGLLNVTGTGAMYDIDPKESGGNFTFFGSSEIIDQYKKSFNDSIKEVKISDGITTIMNRLLYQCRDLVSITLPDSITKIGDEAFAETGIISVTIPGSIKTIGDCAFSRCENLNSATLPDGLESIGEEAFGYTKLTSVTIPGSVKTIGKNAFYSCHNVTSLTLSDGIENIGYGAFDSTKITSVTIPGSVKTIGEYAFCSCESLTTVTLSDGIERIGESAFDSSGLTSVTIPGSVKIIDYDAFENCKSLTEISISEGVQEIGPWAFQWCDKANITIPESVTKIGSQAFRGWGPSQTIYIKGRSSAPSEWDEEGWYTFCNAQVVWNA